MRPGLTAKAMAHLEPMAKAQLPIEVPPKRGAPLWVMASPLQLPELAAKRMQPLGVTTKPAMALSSAQAQVGMAKPAIPNRIA